MAAAFQTHDLVAVQWQVNDAPGGEAHQHRLDLLLRGAGDRQQVVVPNAGTPRPRAAWWMAASSA